MGTPTREYNPAEVVSCSNVQKPYDFEHLNNCFLSTTDCPQSIDEVCSDNHTYQDDYIYTLYH